MRISLNLVFFLMINALTATYAVGDVSFEVSGGPIYAWPEEEGFDGAGGAMLRAKLYTPIVDVEVVPTYFGEFDADDASDTYLEASALSIGVGKDIELTHWLSVYGHLGISYWYAELVFIDEKRGDDDGIGSWAGLGLNANINDLIHFYTGYQRHFDVSGSDINVLLVQAGVEF